jgi:hypothetical protein
MNTSIAVADMPHMPMPDYSTSSIHQTIYREVDMGYAPARQFPFEKPEQRIGIQPAWFTFVSPLEFE